MGLLLLAFVGLTVPNGIFLYWLFTQYQGLGSVLRNHLALSFILDAVLALGILCVYFARRPIGSVAWHWFLALSLVGGLAFSLPLYYWLNLRRGGRIG